MLDQATKTKIKNARDILVGKVPDPKSQIEQITAALIYKFMDDMDRQNQDVGKSASFLTRELAEFSWDNLMSPKISGSERWDLYTRALSEFGKSEQVPELFRTIFSSVYVPFRDPQTLNLFLRQISEFSYDNSEKLGDAYEYLLSILGSQGDAGQFRTPRHIIDFMVEVIAPKKNETILDPACGTAGFLISAYKHIINTNSTNYNADINELPFAHPTGSNAFESSIQNNGNFTGDKLTPADRKKIASNIIGYDISPEMVRLSLVNLYLHKFRNPKIYEYDALSSDDRWDDHFDVILANPPFMTPKGGIQPHQKFSVQANRAEVLFVDYIAEHLTKNGRAAIIVPEGIIFQAANAYKMLRKNLINNWGLYAVVSLPSGVFNPYSGVKTSILFINKPLARKTNDVLFIEIKNDGYELGAQRRTIEQNDLLGAYQALDTWHKTQTISDLGKNIAIAVNKEKISANEHNLTSSKYAINEEHSIGKWPMVMLGDILDYEQPTEYIVSSPNYNDNYDIPVLTAGKTFILGYTNEKTGIYNKELPVIIFDDFTTASKLVDFPFKVKSSAMKILTAQKEKADIKYIFYIMQAIVYPSSTHKRYWISEYSKIRVPLPSIEIQNQFVEEITNLEKMIKSAQTVIDNWSPSYQIDSTWKIYELKDLIETIKPPAKLSTDEYNTSGVYPIIDQSQNEIAGWTDEKIPLITPSKPLVIFGDHTCVVKLVEQPFVQGADGIKILECSDILSPKFLYYTLKAWPLLQDGYNRHFSKLKTHKIAIPTLEVQEKIVAEIEEEKIVIDGCVKLIEKNQAKIKNLINSIWEQ